MWRRITQVYFENNLKRYIEEANVYPQSSFEELSPNKWSNLTPSVISRFFFYCKSIFKRPWDAERFLNDIMLFVIKKILPPKTIEPIWFHNLVYHVDVDKCKCALSLVLMVQRREKVSNCDYIDLTNFWNFN